MSRNIKVFIVTAVYFVLYCFPVGMATEKYDWASITAETPYVLSTTEEDMLFATTVYDQWLSLQPRRVRRKPDIVYKEQIGSEIADGFGKLRIVENSPAELCWKDAVLGGILALRQIEGISCVEIEQIDIGAILIESGAKRYWRVYVDVQWEESVYIIDLAANMWQVIGGYKKEIVG